MALAGVYVWVFAFGGRSAFTDQTAQADGRISYNADEEIALARQAIAQGCQSAQVLASDPGQKAGTVALAFYGLDSPAVNDTVLRLLEEHHCRATFFLNGYEAAENSDFVEAAHALGHALGSTGLRQTDKAHTKPLGDLAESFAHSQKVLTTLTDEPAALLYCPNTVYTSGVLQAAYAGGYAAVAAPEAENLLDYRSFSDSASVKGYLAGLDNGTLLMIRIQGRAEQLPDVPPVTPDVPAIDKQPDEQEQTAPVEVPEENALQLLEWLLEAMEETGRRTVDVGSLAPREDLPGAGQTQEVQTVVFHSFLTGEKAAAVALWSLPDRQGIDEIAALLKKYKAEATFFATEEELTARREDLAALAAAGAELGCGGDDPEACWQLLEEITGEPARLWLPTAQMPMESGEEITELRRRAGELGFSLAAPENPDGAKQGAFYGFDLAGSESLAELERTLETLKGAKLAARSAAALMEDSGSIPALTEQQVSRLRQENGGALAEKVGYVYTAEPALSFLFYGVENQTVVSDVCRILSERGGKATFFVTFDQMAACAGQIGQILAEGHEIGIAYRVSSTYPATFDSVARYIHSCQEYLSWQYGVQAAVVMQTGGEDSEEIREAVSAMGCMMAAAGVTMTRTDHQGVTPEQVPEILTTELAKAAVTRGAQIYFNMNLFDYDRTPDPRDGGSTVCGALVDGVYTYFLDEIAYRNPETDQIEPDSYYQVKTCSDLRGGTLCYTPNEIPPDCAISLENHCLLGIEDENARREYLFSRYIGTPSARFAADLPGFEWWEVHKLNSVGRFTNDKVLFLTFDDWGTDASINHLLYVLEKNQVKATFFIRANNVQYNPNLLRAIAEKGHSIASHSFNHLPLANYVEQTTSHADITEEEAETLRCDAVECYETLYRYVGDMTVDGRRALSTIYRPPTLGVSKSGINQLLDVGYSYVVSGDISTHDYRQESLEDMCEIMKRGDISSWAWRGIVNGSVLVMHMSEDAQYTAQALDIYIPIWKSQGYQFERVDTYLTREAGQTSEGKS